jgi:hypothetical protein
MRFTLASTVARPSFPSPSAHLADAMPWMRSMSIWAG